MNIETIIFDLGGVIIDIDFDKTTECFRKMTGRHTFNFSTEYLSPGLFLQYEKGLITDDQFRKGINEYFHATMSDEQIDQAWNAMLLRLPKARLDLMNECRKTHKVCVLSNTNAIHVRAFNQMIFDLSGQPSLHHFADEVYFSYEMKMRKPDKEIYEAVLEQSDIKAETALFLDDTLENIQSAKALGIQTLHVKKPNDIFRIKDFLGK